MLRFSLGAIAAAVLAVVACSSSDGAVTPTGTSSGTSDGTSSGTDGTSSGTSGTSGTSSGIMPKPDSDEVAGIVRSSISLDIAGMPRRYVLTLPKDYDANKEYPLIVALHGDGEGADMFVAFSKLDVVAGKSAIMAFPDQVLELFTAYDDNPDQQLVKAVIDDVQGKHKVDAAKIWGFGYSKGAYMLEELQCRKKSTFTAMVVHAGGAPEERNADESINCPGAKPIPMFLTQGSNDQETGVEFGANFWASVAGCGDTRTKTTPAYCGAYESCNAQTPVVYCEIPGQPHFPLYDNAATDGWKWLNSL